MLISKQYTKLPLTCNTWRAREKKQITSKFCGQVYRWVTKECIQTAFIEDLLVVVGKKKKKKKIIDLEELLVNNVLYCIDRYNYKRLSSVDFGELLVADGLGTYDGAINIFKC